jgi:hypothetical protein
MFQFYQYAIDPEYNEIHCYVIIDDVSYEMTFSETMFTYTTTLSPIIHSYLFSVSDGCNTVNTSLEFIDASQPPAATTFTITFITNAEMQIEVYLEGVQIKHLQTTSMQVSTELEAGDYTYRAHTATWTSIEFPFSISQNTTINEHVVPIQDGQVSISYLGLFEIVLGIFGSMAVIWILIKIRRSMNGKKNHAKKNLK